MSTDPVDDDTELLHQGFPVEEIVGGDEEIPEEGEDEQIPKEGVMSKFQKKRSMCKYKKEEEVEDLWRRRRRLLLTRTGSGTRAGCPSCRRRNLC